MALRTRKGVAILIPAASLRYLSFSLWAAQLLTVPFAIVAVMGVLAALGVMSEEDYNDLGSPLLGLALLFWALGVMLIAYGVLFFIDIVAAQEKQLARAVLSSRFAFWVGCWAVANLACVVLTQVPIPEAWPFALGGAWIAAVFAFWHAVSSLRRTSKRSRSAPMYGNLTDDEMMFVTKPEARFGPGADFPKAPRSVTTVRAARAYAALAAKRQFLREQLGMMMRVVGGAFIGAVGLWTFSEDPGPRIFVFFSVLLVVFAGFQIERRHKFYETLGSAYSARAKYIAAARRRRAPRLRSSSRFRQPRREPREIT